MQRATVVFVKAEQGSQRHRVWITRDDGHTYGLRLHVVHDLPHFAVESVLRIDDGLWSTLVETGSYPGLTDEHLVAKALTNAIGQTLAVMRSTLSSYERPDRAARASFDSDAAARVGSLLTRRMAGIDESTLPRAVELRGVLLRRWAATPVGENMTLRWPMD